MNRINLLSYLIVLVTVLFNNSAFNQAQLIKDINPVGPSYPDNFCIIGNTIFFTANDGIHGREPWVSDGTTNGTFLLSDITAGTDSTEISRIVAFNGFAFFLTREGNNTISLWKSNGTITGTEVIHQQNGTNLENVVTASLVVSGGQLFIGLYQSYPFTYSPIWKTDGTALGTVLITNTAAMFMTAFNGEIYFSSNGLSMGEELWKSDGTAAGTVLVKDINPGNAPSYPRNFKEIDGVLYFAARNSSEGYEFWKTDGTTAGTELVKDIYTGLDYSTNPNGSIPDQFTKVGNEFYFRATTDLGTELWKSDGTTTGTSLVLDIYSGGTSSDPKFLTEANNKLFFTANPLDNNYEVWTTDGTSSGTFMPRNVNPLDNSYFVTDYATHDVFNFNDTIYFTATDWVNGLELWTTDGTFCGTKIVTDINPGSAGSNPSRFNQFGNSIVFMANDGVCGTELWKFTPNQTYNYTSYEEVSACVSYTWPLTGQTFNSNGLYIDTIPVSGSCDSIVALNLTILNPTFGIDSHTACDSLTWIDGNTYYASTNTPTWTLVNTAGCDSIVTLNLTIVPTLQTTVQSGFSLPSDPNNCLGEYAVDISGNPDFELAIDNGMQTVTSPGYSLVAGLCAGVHDLQIINFCGDTILTQFVIPIDSNYVFNNPFIDSLAQDSLGVTLTNCDIYYNSIDTAYIDSIWAIGNTVNVIWNIVDSNGSNFDTTSYVLNNGTGVYWLQLSVFCPTKAFGDYFTVTEAIYFGDGYVSTAGVSDKEMEEISVFPNPTSNVVTVKFESPSAKLNVLDAQGKLIQQHNITSGSTIDLSKVESGIYFFELTAEKGKVVKRLVKN